jgi:ATP-binding cassette subfamily B protein
LNPAAIEPLTVEAVIRYTIIMLICIGGRVIIRYHIMRLRSGAGYEVMCEQRKILGKELRRVSMGYFSKRNIGDLVSTVTSDLSYMELYGIGVLEKVINGVLAVLIGIIFLFVFDYRIASAVCLLFIPSWFAFTHMSAVQDKLDLNRQEQVGVVTEDTIEYIKGLHILKNCNMTENRFSKTKAAFRRFSDIMLRLELAHVVPFAVIQLCFRIITLTVILLSAIFVTGGSLSFQSAIVLILSSFSLFTAVEILGVYAAFIRLGQHCMDRINQVKRIGKMDETPENSDIDRYDIEYDAVTFAYENREVLHNISFSTPMNSTTALVGMSGSGKTTIVHLLARFWDIEKGTIKIGGKHVQSLTYELLMKNISFVFQDVFSRLLIKS